MRALVFSYTLYRNTKKMIEIIKSQLDAKNTAAMVPFENLLPQDIERADLFVMGSPVHAFNLPGKFRQ